MQKEDINRAQLAQYFWQEILMQISRTTMKETPRNHVWERYTLPEPTDTVDNLLVLVLKQPNEAAKAASFSCTATGNVYCVQKGERRPPLVGGV